MGQVRERHRSHRIGWLRAVVLGANDGIVSTASLVLGVDGGGGSQETIAIAGIAGLVAGAMSMAAGEYVSVSSQADAERADLEIERRELAADHAAEREELAQIYRERGVKSELASQVAEQLMKYDALGAHARDELGITLNSRARPTLAAFASAGAFALGAIIPVAVVWTVSPNLLAVVVTATSLFVLAGLGALAARAGGASTTIGAVRVTFWGAFAMAATYMVGKLFETVV